MKNKSICKEMSVVLNGEARIKHKVWVHQLADRPNRKWSVYPTEARSSQHLEGLWFLWRPESLLYCDGALFGWGVVW